MDDEPDAIIITQEGAVQRWDMPESITFRLDVWPAGDSDERDEADQDTE